MKKSESIKELATALAKAQAEMTIAEMDGHNPHYDSKFASLTSIVKASRPALTKHGISIMQLPSFTEAGNPILETIIAHSSGEWIQADVKLLLAKQDSQGLLSAITYTKRGVMAAAVGVVADEDIDGNDTIADSKPKSEPKVEPKTAPKQISKPALVNHADALHCIKCSDALKFNPKNGEYFCTKKHVTGLKGPKLEAYRQTFADTKARNMGLEPQGVGL